jgi:hypothetical protein
MSEDLTLSEREELEMLRKEKMSKGGRGLYLKVSQKGAVSLYGLGRFPVTLYKEQWEKVFEYIDEMKEFIQKNSDQLSTKNK